MKNSWFLALLFDLFVWSRMRVRNGRYLYMYLLTKHTSRVPNTVPMSVCLLRFFEVPVSSALLELSQYMGTLALVNALGPPLLLDNSKYSLPWVKHFADTWLSHWSRSVANCTHYVNVNKRSHTHSCTSFDILQLTLKNYISNVSKNNVSHCFFNNSRIERGRNSWFLSIDNFFMWEPSAIRFYYI